MKYILILLVASSVSKVSAQNPTVSILETVLTDGEVMKYISDYGEIDTLDFVLSGKDVDYVFHHGKVHFSSPDSSTPQEYAGTIRKLKVHPSKAAVKIYFHQNNNFLVKIKLKHFSKKGPWHVTSRLIRRKFKNRKDQPGLFYFSLN